MQSADSALAPRERKQGARGQVDPGARAQAGGRRFDASVTGVLLASQSVMRRARVVVVTGASAGVGRATARAFAQAGADVALLARNAEALGAARREVEA